MPKFRITPHRGRFFKPPHKYASFLLKYGGRGLCVHSVCTRRQTYYCQSQRGPCRERTCSRISVRTCARRAPACAHVACVRRSRCDSSARSCHAAWRATRCDPPPPSRCSMAWHLRTPLDVHGRRRRRLVAQRVIPCSASPAGGDLVPAGPPRAERRARRRAVCGAGRRLDCGAKPPLLPRRPPNLPCNSCGSPWSRYHSTAHVTRRMPSCPTAVLVHGPCRKAGFCLM